MAFTADQLAVIIPTLVGSLLSTLGAGFILVCYMLLPIQTHFRHALIINLALSDFANALNNSISGVYIVIVGTYPRPGPACVANGFFSQLTVQATDVNILAIAIVTLLTLRGIVYIPDESLWPKILVSMAIWLMPLITSFVALGQDMYGPTTGNWCWIKEEPLYYRYVLTHGWRYLFILITIIIYINVYVFLHRHFKTLKSVSSKRTAFYSTYNWTNRTATGTDSSTIDEKESPSVGVAWKISSPKISEDSTAPLPPPRAPIGAIPVGPLDRTETATSPETKDQFGTHTSVFSPYSPRKPDGLDLSVSPKANPPPSSGRSGSVSEDKIKRTLLLNAYPIAYIILWLPGLANRLVEATGREIFVLEILQALTQFIGLANAITYGINENVWKQLKEHANKGKERAKEVTGIGLV